MSEAREVTDRLTDALLSQSLEAVVECYHPEAVLIAPEGTFKGREQIAEFFGGWVTPFSELDIEFTTKAAWGNQALDEWSMSATNTGTLELPTGESVPATGRRVTVRGADVCTVEDGAVIAHRIYYDQAELVGQLQLAPQ